MATDTKKKGVLHVFGIEKRDDRNEPGKTFNIWTRIGTAFVNDDESINLKLSYVPLGPDVTIQVRKPDERSRGAEERRRRTRFLAQRARTNFSWGQPLGKPRGTTRAAVPKEIPARGARSWTDRRALCASAALRPLR